MRKYKHRDRSTHKGEEYVQMYKLDKWINQCVQCQARGYKETLLKGIGRVGEHAANTIRKYFTCLPLNEQGLCEVCAK